jgi:hypothetical protein
MTGGRQNAAAADLQARAAQRLEEAKLRAAEAWGDTWSDLGGRLDMPDWKLHCVRRREVAAARLEPVLARIEALHRELDRLNVPTAGDLVARQAAEAARQAEIRAARQDEERRRARELALAEAAEERRVADARSFDLLSSHGAGAKVDWSRMSEAARRRALGLAPRA